MTENLVEQLPREVRPDLAVGEMMVAGLRETTLGHVVSIRSSLSSSKTSMTTTPRNPHPSVLTSGPSSPPPNSPAQLAAVLAETLQENESLKRELAIARRKLEMYERMFSSTHKPPQSSTSPPSLESHLWQLLQLGENSKR